MEEEILEGTSAELAEQLRLPERADRWFRVIPLPKREQPEPTPEEIAQADARFLRHRVNLGYAVDLDNEQIDADLAF